MDPRSEKTCTQCEETKPLEQFHRSKRGAHGRTSKCKPCANENARQWNAANPERVRENVRRSYAANPERKREHARRRYAANPEQAREYMRRWTAANPEQARKHSRRWRVANLERARENSRQWAATNPEQKREYMRQWRTANPDRGRMYSANRRAREQQVNPSPWSREKIANLYDGCCHLCGWLITSDEEMHFDHVIPLSRLSPGMTELLAPAHSTCNLVKGDRDVTSLPAPVPEIVLGTPAASSE